MQTFTVEEAARRWLSAPKLDPETERAAAEATIAFLTDVRSKIEAHLEDIKAGRAPADGSGLQEVWDFSHFDPKHIDFLLATLGEGEVRIKLFGGEAKAGDTSVPGLWRVQSGRSGQENFFVLARLPRSSSIRVQMSLQRRLFCRNCSTGWMLLMPMPACRICRPILASCLN